MKKSWILGLLLLLLVACSGNEPPQPTEMPAVQPTQPVLEPLATELPADYPALPTATPFPPGYPAPRPTPSLPPGYPAAGSSWMVKPAGVQCQPLSVDLDGGIAELENAGITTYRSTMALLPVCEACDSCPSSEHYRVEIGSNQVPQAEALGWQREQ